MHGFDLASTAVAPASYIQKRSYACVIGVLGTSIPCIKDAELLLLLRRFALSPVQGTPEKPKQAKLASASSPREAMLVSETPAATELGSRLSKVR